MSTRKMEVAVLATLIFAFSPMFAYAQVTGDAPGVRPDAIVDLKTDEGIELVKGQWRYRKFNNLVARFNRSSGESQPNQCNCM